MKSNIRIFSLWMALSFALAACAPAPATTQPEQPTVDVNPIYTAAAKTIEVESTRKAALIPTATATATSTAAPTATATAVVDAATSANPTPTIWIPMSGSDHPSISSTYDTNCRQGPDESFDVVGGLRVGDTSKVNGMLADRSWWYIQNPGKEDPAYCWVWGGTTTVSGSTDAVPEMPVPATPYKSLPTISLGLSISPSSASSCPTTVTFTGTIKTSAEGNFSYQIYDDEGNILKSGVMSFKDDGTDSVSFTKKYSSTYKGWIQMKVSNPVSQKSGKVSIAIDCDDD